MWHLLTFNIEMASSNFAKFSLLTFESETSQNEEKFPFIFSHVETLMS